VTDNQTDKSPVAKSCDKSDISKAATILNDDERLKLISLPCIAHYSTLHHVFLSEQIKMMMMTIILRFPGPEVQTLMKRSPDSLWTPAQRKRASMLYFANVFFNFFYGRLILRPW